MFLLFFFGFDKLTFYAPEYADEKEVIRKAAKGLLRFLPFYMKVDKTHGHIWGLHIEVPSSTTLPQNTAPKMTRFSLGLTSLLSNQERKPRLWKKDFWGLQCDDRNRSHWKPDAINDSFQGNMLVVIKLLWIQFDELVFLHISVINTCHSRLVLWGWWSFFQHKREHLLWLNGLTDIDILSVCLILNDGLLSL